MCSCCDPAQGCASGGCNGGFLEDAWNYAKTYGLVTGGDYDSIKTGDSCFPYQLPFCSHHEPGKYANCSTTEYATPACPIEKGAGCSETTYPTAWAQDKTKATSGYSLDTVAAIQADMVARGTVSVAFTVYSDFLTYKSGVYKHVTGQSLGGHAVKVRETGWGAWLKKCLSGKHGNPAPLPIHSRPRSSLAGAPPRPARTTGSSRTGTTIA